MSDLHLNWLADFLPYVSLSQETSKNQERFDGDSTVTSYHLNIIHPEMGQRPLYLDMVQDDHLTHN